MKTTLVILLLSCLAASVTGAPAESRTERDMEATPSHAALTAADLHPHTPILLADLDESIPALVVIRERAMTLAELEQAIQAEERERDVDREHTQAMETEADEDEDDETSADEDDDDSALIESDFEISAPYGGYGGYGGYGKKGGYGYGGLGYGGYGGFGKKGGYGFGYGSKKIPYKKVPYKKVPLKKVPFKKGPPKKKAPPKKKGGYGGFGFGLKKGGFGYGGGFGGHH